VESGSRCWGASSGDWFEVFIPYHTPGHICSHTYHPVRALPMHDVLLQGVWNSRVTPGSILELVFGVKPVYVQVSPPLARHVQTGQMV
jgi:hypothetical protein